MKLHNYFRSSASWRVRIALAIKGLDCDYLAVHLPKREHLADDFSALSASRLVPLLDAARRLCQDPSVGLSRCGLPVTLDDALASEPTEAHRSTDRHADCDVCLRCCLTH